MKTKTTAVAIIAAHWGVAAMMVRTLGATPAMSFASGGAITALMLTIVVVGSPLCKERA